MTAHPDTAAATPPVPTTLSRVVEVVMQRVAQSSQWQPFRWQLRTVAWVEELDGSAELPAAVRLEDSLVSYRRVTLFPDEAEGYYLNLTTERPAWMVHFRLNESSASEPPEVRFVTLSYNEAGRLLDAGEPVETFPIDPATAHWLAQYTDAHYVMAPRKRQRPRSFVSPGDRAAS